MVQVLEALLDGYMWLGWLVLSIVGAWVALILCFYAVMYAKQLVEDGAEFNWFFLFPIYAGYFIGIVLDILFNWSVGTYIYREFPKWGEFTFTARCTRHKKKGATDWRGRRAMWWCAELSKIHLGHC